MGNTMTALNLMESKFKPGSIIFITGASSGIGEEMAYQYALRKIRLFIVARSVDKLKQVAEKCRALGSECEYAYCDVSVEADCKNAIEKCVERYGGIDLLVVNAGVNAHIFFKDVTDLSIYEKLMKINFFGYLYPTKYAFPHLEQSKGQILVISSASGEVGFPMRTAYCSSKFAVTGFFESLRIETANTDVAITIVCPPSVDTPMKDRYLVNAVSEANHPKPAEQEEKKLPVDECVKNIIFAADRRARKVYFPTLIYVGNYVRPFFPWLIDGLIRKKAKL